MQAFRTGVVLKLHKPDFLCFYKRYDPCFTCAAFKELDVAVSVLPPLTEADAVPSHTGCSYLNTQLTGSSNEQLKLYMKSSLHNHHESFLLKPSKHIHTLGLFHILSCYNRKLNVVYWDFMQLARGL